MRGYESQSITERSSGRQLPTHRPPTHPGEMLEEEFLKPLEISRAELARHLDIPYSRLSSIIKGRSPVTPNMPTTCDDSRRLWACSADFWLGLQQDWDLLQAMRRPEARAIFRLKPLAAAKGIPA